MDSILKAQAYVQSLEKEIKDLRNLLASSSSSSSTPVGHIPPAPFPPSPRLSPKSPRQGMRVVVKVGTSSLVNSRTGIKLGQVASIMEFVAQLRRDGHQVILVMSGAVGTGAHELGFFERPTSISLKQALSSVGQVRLMRELNSMLSTLGFHSAQILLTYVNLIEHSQYIKARNTIEELLALGVVPICNENDTVTNTEELRFGDNDRLSAIVACLVDADLLVLLTDVNGVFTANPNVDKNAKRIPIIRDIESHREAIKTGGTSEFSTGGMSSKLQAAQIATKNGMHTLIMCSQDVRFLTEPILTSLLQNEELAFGTVFLPSAFPVKGIKQWIVSLPDMGTLILDAESSSKFKNLKEEFCIDPCHVVAFTGTFSALDSLVCVSEEDPSKVLGHVLVNLSSEDVELVKGKAREEVILLLGSDHGMLHVVDPENIVRKVGFNLF